MSQTYDYDFIGYGDYLVYKSRLLTGEFVSNAVRWTEIKHIRVKVNSDPIKLSISAKSEKLNFPMKDMGNVDHFVDEAAKAGVTLVQVASKQEGVIKFNLEISLSDHISHTGTWESGYQGE